MTMCLVSTPTQAAWAQQSIIKLSNSNNILGEKMLCWLLVGFDGTAKVELNDILYSDWLFFVLI